MNKKNDKFTKLFSIEKKFLLPRPEKRWGKKTVRIE